MLVLPHQADSTQSTQFPSHPSISQAGPVTTSTCLAAYSQGSRAMKCAPKAGWMLVGFGVAISLLLAIFVLALANSNRKVWGFSGSKRMPCHRRKHTNLSEVRFPVQAQVVSTHGEKPNQATKAIMLRSHARIFVPSLQHSSSHRLVFLFLASLVSLLPT